MPSIRCEELVFDRTRTVNGAPDDTDNSTVDTIGSSNTTTTLSGTSAVVFGPATDRVTVFVRAIGGQAYMTKGQSTPTATAANSLLIVEDGGFIVELRRGESIAALSATVA